MKLLLNIWLIGSAILSLYFAWQWNTTQSPQYEPKIAIISGISAIVAFWVKSNNGSSNSAFFIGSKNKISQTSQSNEKENRTGFMGSENELNQK